MSIIIQGIKDAFQACRKHWPALVALLFMQALFASAFLAVQVTHWSTVMVKGGELQGYLEGIDTNPEVVTTDGIMQGNLLGDDPQLVFRNFDAIKMALIALAWQSVTVFIVFNGLTFMLVAWMLGQRDFKLYGLGFVFITAVMLVPVSLFVYLLFQAGITEFLGETVTAALMVIILCLLLCVYYLYVGYAVASCVEGSTLQRLWRTVYQMFRVGTRWMHLFLLVVLMGGLLVYGLGSLLYLAVEGNTALVMFLMLLVLCAMIALKIAFFAVVRRGVEAMEKGQK